MRQSSHEVEEWLKVHRTLMDMETAFTDLAIRAISGEVPRADLEDARSRLMATRELCTAAYARAFPKSQQPPK